MQDTEQEEHRLGVREIIALARRRIWWIIVPALAGPLVGYVVSRKISPVFTSQAFVLVEQQKVPDAFVPSMVTDHLETRLLTMQDQILSRSRLQPIITELGLYRDQKKSASMDELVDRLRHDIKVTPIRPDSSVTLRGFYVSVDANRARTAQQVCERVLAMFMEENLKVQSDRAESTTAFLASQLEDAKHKLDASDAKLADFKSKYIGRLPSDEQSNLQMLASLGSQLDAVTESLAQAQQQRELQASMLAAQTATSKGSQTVSGKRGDLEQKLSDLRLQLSALEARYTEEYPDVKKVKAQIATLQEQLRVAQQTTPAQDDGQKSSISESPELAQMRIALVSTEETIRRKKAEQAKLTQQIGNIQARIQLSPMVEEEFKGLTRDYESSLQFYNELLTKKTQSEMVRDLEQRREGEQFHIMDTPGLPSKPTSPNKVKFAFGGLAAGFAFGVLLAVIMDFKERLIRTEEDMVTYLQAPMLCAIQDLEQGSMRTMGLRSSQ